MSIENVIQEHTKAIQENTVAITLLATAISKIALTGAALDNQAAAATNAAHVATQAAAAVNLEAKQPATKKEKPAPVATPEPEVQTAPIFTYEADVKPQLVKVAQLPDGRTKLSNLLAHFKVKTGAELKPEQFTSVLQHAEALLNEPESLV